MLVRNWFLWVPTGDAVCSPTVTSPDLVKGHQPLDRFCWKMEILSVPSLSMSALHDLADFVPRGKLWRSISTVPAHERNKAIKLAKRSISLAKCQWDREKMNWELLSHHQRRIKDKQELDWNCLSIQPKTAPNLNIFGAVLVMETAPFGKWNRLFSLKTASLDSKQHKTKKRQKQTF